MTKGRLEFLPETEFWFEFYRKQRDGNIPWREPFSTIPAIAHPEFALDILDEDSLFVLVRSCGFDQVSSEKIAASYSEEWLRLLDDTSLMMRTGLALYDARRHEEALSVFKEMRRRVLGHQLGSVVALIWQGHMLDLLGRRDEAVVAYESAVAINVEDTLWHEQYDLTLSSEYAAQRIRIPFERIENLLETTAETGASP